MIVVIIILAVTSRMSGLVRSVELFGLFLLLVWVGTH